MRRPRARVRKLKLPSRGARPARGTVPLPSDQAVQHPAMAAAPACMHDTASGTDVSPHAGPVTARVDARYLHRWALIGGLCPAFGFDSTGAPITISFSARRTDLLRLDSKLHIRDSLRLPRRRGTVRALLQSGLDEVFRDTSGGAYFFVDADDHVVVPTASGEIWVVGIRPRFRVVRKIRLPFLSGARLTACLPVWQHSEAYWYTTREGAVGVAGDRRAQPVQLPQGEQIQNAFAVNARGAFVVSNHALYLLALERDAARIGWRTPYRRGRRRKPGQIDLGSGTTPTLLGDRWVVFGDGREPMRVVVVDQRTGKIADERAVFTDKRGSACENSMIGYGDSVVVGNTFGYSHPLKKPRTEGGLLRLDVHPDTGRLSQRWYNPDVDVMSAVPKLSLKTGLLYAYTRRGFGRPRAAKRTVRRKQREEWCLVGVDFRTGNVRYRLPVFRGPRHTHHDNAWGTISLGPDALYLGMWNGCLRVEDYGPS